MEQENTDTAQNLAIDFLTETIFVTYGYDFRQYAEASLRRRILRAKERFGFSSIHEITARIQSDRAFFQILLTEITVTVSEMFRDPDVYRAIADEVLPILATYPSIRIWHAGCSTGEEVYSMAILLKEEGLLERATIYATDINPLALQQAKSGIFPTSELPRYTENYQRAGRSADFSRYYTAGHGMAIFDRRLRENMVFAEHSLSTDGVFSEIHLIVCRNVFIYFNRTMQNRALKLFCESLPRSGFLCIGSKESLEFMDYRETFRKFSRTSHIYQKSEVG